MIVQKGLLAEVTVIDRVHEGTLRVKVVTHTHIKKIKTDIRKVKSYLVSCKKGQTYKIGDKVSIVSCAPVSKLKRFKVREDI